ncbi:unnamed protein product, partial [Bemisia tabaci]
AVSNGQRETQSAYKTVGILHALRQTRCGLRGAAAEVKIIDPHLCLFFHNLFFHHLPCPRRDRFTELNFRAKFRELLLVVLTGLYQKLCSTRVNASYAPLPRQHVHLMVFIECQNE